MADRIWLKNYPAGIPAEIDADRFRSHTGHVREDCRQVRRQAGVSQPRPHAELRRRSIGCRAISPRSCRDCRAWARASASPSCRRTCCNIRWRCSASSAPA